MRAQIRRAGDSVELTVPADLAAQAGLHPDKAADVEVVGGRLVVTPTSGRRYTLDELLAGVTDDNIHGEIKTGPSVGAEEW
jgi:antitoxin MazE